MKEFYEEVGARIKKYRKNMGWTLEELGNRIGVGKSTVRKYETGMIRVSHEKLEDMANAMGIDVSLLYGEDAKRELVYLPLYGQIACGSGTVIYEDPEEYQPAPVKWVENGIYFFLIAKGDSMVGAKIHEGDLLLIRKQSEVENGAIAAVAIDGECVLKRVYRNNGAFTLISENPKFPPIMFDPSTDKHIQVIGKLEKAITLF